MNGRTLFPVISIEVESSHPDILIITGPTASGKSSLAMAVAQKVPSEIISADSRQIYRHLTIGTAKPSSDDLRTVPHHLVDIIEPNERFSAWEFQKRGREAVRHILARKKLPIIVGGTGLYIKALVDGIFEQPEFTKGVRGELEERLKTQGALELHRELEHVDPNTARTVPVNRTPLIIRALEVFYETGVPISHFHARQKKENLYRDRWFALEWDRSMLYHRIDERVQHMVDNGLVNEVETLLGKGFNSSLQSLQTVGYKEVIAYLQQEISLDRMKELIQQNTRRFAKRQMTWFRKEERIQWIKIRDQSDILTSASNTIIETL